MSKSIIKTAVFPAAGLGTRFLPATKSQPKEMLPLVDKPMIQYVVEEAKKSGIEHIVLVTGIDKSGKLIIHDPAGRGSRALMSSRDFLRVWRGFLVDLRGDNFSNTKANGSVMISKGESTKKEMVKRSSL